MTTAMKKAGMKKADKQKVAAAVAIALLLLLVKYASAKAPKGVVSVGPITVEDKDETPDDILAQKRAALRYQLLDLIAYDEDRDQPTRRPTVADKLVLDSILAGVQSLSRQIPDPEGYDREYDAHLLSLVSGAMSLPTSTSSAPPKAFGWSRYASRRVDIEKAVMNLVALDKQRRIQRRPTDGEMAVIRSLINEYDALGQKLLALDDSEPLDGEPLQQIADLARSRVDPTTAQTVPPVATFVPGMAGTGEAVV